MKKFCSVCKKSFKGKHGVLICEVCKSELLKVAIKAKTNMPTTTFPDDFPTEEDIEEEKVDEEDKV